MYYTIYKITNSINNKIYIGRHITDNLYDDYMGSGARLHLAYKKYGIENFSKEILYIFDTFDEMNTKEKELVTTEFCLREDTYNLTVGGGNGWEYVNRLGLNLYGLNGQSGHGLENLFRGNLREYLTKKGIYNEYIEHQRKIHLDGYASGRIQPAFKGKHHTEETVNKLKGHTRQVGAKNSQYGTCWITNIELKINKKIPLEDIQIWLNQGWHKGKIQNFNKFDNRTCKKFKLPIEKVQKPINLVKVKKENDFKLKAEKLFKDYINSDCKSIRDFVKQGYYDKSHVMLTKLWKRYIPDYHDHLKLRKTIK